MKGTRLHLDHLHNKIAKATHPLRGAIVRTSQQTVPGCMFGTDRTGHHADPCKTDVESCQDHVPFDVLDIYSSTSTKDHVFDNPLNEDNRQP